MFSSDRPSWRNPRVLSTLLMIFLAGSVTGAVVMQKYIHVQLGRQVPRISYDQLHRELDLTPEQAAKLKQILDDVLTFNKDLEHQIADTRATGKYRILSILDERQKRKFEKICDETPVL